MAKMKKSGDGVKKGGGVVIVIAVLALVVVVAMGATIGYLLLSRGKTEAEAPAQEEPAQRSVLVTPENVDEIMSEQPEETDADRYTVAMNTYWNFADGSSESSNAHVRNHPDNVHPVYFDILLADTGETIYQSPILPVGVSLDKIKLDKALDDGIYDCVVVYHLVDDAQNTLSTVNVKLTINVGNVSPLG